MSSSSQQSQLVTTLPSIQEMFPEHLLSLPPSVRLSIMATIKSSTLGIRTNDISRHPVQPSSENSSNHCTSLPSSAHSYRKVLSNLAAAENSFTSVDPPESETCSHPSFSPSTSSTNPPWAEDDTEEADIDESEDLMIDSSKKHTCLTCYKRFNRPSSLRIHANTHTGETPFRCPYPGCGRMFNVNSNMRRHYRNHVTATNPSMSGTQVIDYSIVPRQRRKRTTGNNAEMTVDDVSNGTQDLSHTPAISFPSVSHSSGTPVLKKAQWSRNALNAPVSHDLDDTKDSSDSMDVDTEKFYPEKSDSFAADLQITPSSLPSQFEFNYPVYTPRRRYSNCVLPGSFHSSSHNSDSRSPWGGSGDKHEQGHISPSPSKSPRSSLFAIANLIR